MKLCLMSIMMGRQCPPETIVRTAVSCGLEAVDWVTDHGADPRVLKKLSADAGLTVASYTTLMTHGLTLDNGTWRDRVRREIEIASLLGAPRLMFPPFALHGQTSLADGLQRWTEFFAEVVPQVLEAGITPTLESTGMPDSPVATGEEVASVLNAAPGLKLTFDYGNTATACDADAAYEQLKGSVVQFHLKDWNISVAPFPGAQKKRTGQYYADSLIGEGDLNLKQFWAEVDASHRELWVDLETCDPAGHRSLPDALRLVADNLRSW